MVELKGENDECYGMSVTMVARILI